jgi:hypothetical protein
MKDEEVNLEFYRRGTEKRETRDVGEKEKEAKREER